MDKIVIIQIVPLLFPSVPIMEFYLDIQVVRTDCYRSAVERYTCSPVVNDNVVAT
jgi:hypothetical protein